MVDLSTKFGHLFVTSGAKVETIFNAQTVAYGAPEMQHTVAVVRRQAAKTEHFRENRRQAHKGKLRLRHAPLAHPQVGCLKVIIVFLVAMTDHQGHAAGQAVQPTAHLAVQPSNGHQRPTGGAVPLEGAAAGEPLANVDIGGEVAQKERGPGGRLPGGDQRRQARVEGDAQQEAVQLADADDRTERLIELLGVPESRRIEPLGHSSGTVPRRGAHNRGALSANKSSPKRHLIKSGLRWATGRW